MHRFQLLAIDIDGTLLNSHDELTPATRQALVRTGESGIHVVLATGRRYSRTLHLIEPLGIDVPLVTASGALVKDPIDHRTLYRADFPRQTLCEALAVVNRCGYDPVLCCDTFTAGFDFYYRATEVESPELTEYFSLNSQSGRHWPELVTDPPPEAFNAFTMGTQAEMLALEAELQRQLPDKLHTHVLRTSRYVGFMCELAPAGVTKWSAILRLAHDWGIDQRAICAVGDDVNDIPMIQEAGLGVAMGNALPAVKAAADRIAPTHDEEGLVEVTRWLLQ